MLGATITGNRGAESMLRAAVQRIPEFAPGARFTLLSLYPRDDLAENDDPTLRIVPFSPAQMVLLALPLALAAGGLRRLGLPYRFLLLTRGLRSIDDADLLVDLSGISFVDGRSLMLLYNVLVVLLPALLGTPVLKYSQALGPFRGRWNRALARWILPRTARIAARGRKTREHLDELHLPPGKVIQCADAAFAMHVGDAARARVAPILAALPADREWIAVSASSVVEALCRRQGIDYVEELGAFLQRLIDEKGCGVCLVAHSARPGRAAPKNNDLPVCRRVARRVDRAACVLPQENLNAQALRALIGRCRMLIASRFHAMVSGLAMGVPVLLVGWSHKYREVLEDFELDRYALDYADVSSAALRELFERLERDAPDVRRRIAERLPAVVESSLDNARAAAALLASAERRAAHAAPSTLASSA